MTNASTSRALLAAIGLSLCTAACAGAQKAPPAASEPVARATLSDPKAVAEAQRTLKSLGYDPGPADGKIGGKTEDAVRAYQKHEKLAVDGRLTHEIAERLKSGRVALPGASWGDLQRGVTAIYTDGPELTLVSRDKIQETWRGADGTQVTRPVNFLLSTDTGASTDAQPNFLQPLKPGAKGTYSLHRKDPANGADTTATVTCTIGSLTHTAVPAGTFDTIDATCQDDAHPSTERRFSYSTELRMVIREETRREGQDSKTRELVGLRPSTQNWPSAAAIGLDWAVNHALDQPADNEPVRWSSTAVKEKYVVKVDRSTPVAIPGNAGSCLRYELVRTDREEPRLRYPALACKSAEGSWVIPGPEPQKIAHPSANLAQPDQTPTP